MGALVLDLFCPLHVSLFQSFVSKILMSRCSIALFKTVALEMPLVTGDQAGIVERWGIFVDMLVEDMFIIFCNDPLFDRSRILGEVSEVFRLIFFIFILINSGLFLFVLTIVSFIFVV